MRGRVVMAGIVGGIVLFVWSSISHMVLGLGSVGFRSLADEEVVLEAMRGGVGGDGLYFFPWMDPDQFGNQAAI